LNWGNSANKGVRSLGKSTEIAIGTSLITSVSEERENEPNHASRKSGIIRKKERIQRRADAWRTAQSRKKNGIGKEEGYWHKRRELTRREKSQRNSNKRLTGGGWGPVH